MARPIKQGLDYFTLDCHFDDKVELLIAEFGMVGLGILIRLYQKIYSEDGYFCRWNEDVALLFSRNNGVGGNVVSEVISACLRRGLFDCGLYERCGILTSKGIQQRYFEAVTKRKSVNVENEYLLIPISKNSNNSDNNSINDGNNSINDGNNSQSKLNKTKSNKTKVNENKVEQIKNQLLLTYSSEDKNTMCPSFMVPESCLLSVAEYDALNKHISNESILMSYMSRVGSYKKTKQFDTIVKWAIQDGYWSEETINGKV